MKREIGSIFEISKETIGYEDNLNLDFLSGLAQKNVSLTASGREAIELVVDCVERDYAGRLKKKCILPMYTCDTVIIPFEKHGWDIQYYDINLDFSIDLKKLQMQIEMFCPDVILFHAYYGIPLSRETEEFFSRKQGEGVLVIEDMTQNMNGEKLQRSPDYFVGSLRKWFSIADGGFAASNRELLAKPEMEKEEFVKHKLRALTDKYQYLSGELVEKDQFLMESRKAEDYLYQDDAICEMSTVSKYLLNRIDKNKTYSQRTENAVALWEGLSHIEEIRLGIKSKSLIQAPLYFPILVENREKLQSYLTGKDVYVPVLWPVPEQLSGLSENVDDIFRHILAIPCDFRYGVSDMNDIVELIKEFIESQG